MPPRAESGCCWGQWLRVLGATAIGTVGSPEKTAIAKANGYSHVIDYRAEDFTARVKDITGSRGCDVVYDSVGKDTWRGSLKCLRARGMFVHFGQSSGMIVDFKFSDLMSGGSLFATRPMLFDYIKSREDLSSRAADLFARLGRGDIQAHVGRRVALRDAAEAHRELEGRRTTGRDGAAGGWLSTFKRTAGCCRRIIGRRPRAAVRPRAPMIAAKPPAA